MSKRTHNYLDNPTPKVADPFFEGSDYRDSKEARSLLIQIEKFVRKARITRIGAIQRAVEIPRGWNLRDIIEVSTKIERVPGYFDYFVWRQAKVGLPKANEFNVCKASPKITADLGW